MFVYLKMYFNKLNMEECFYSNMVIYYEGRNNVWNICGVVDFYFCYR